MKPMSYEKAMPRGGAPKPGEYFVNEMFYSVQGEGGLTGTPMVFVRFARCNLRCNILTAGFDCDTEFQGYSVMDLDTLLSRAAEKLGRAADGDWMLLTGGEPGLQLTDTVIAEAKAAGWRLAVETNGTIKLPPGLDWICVSPKSAGHTIRQRKCDEIKYVLSDAQELPELPGGMQASHRWVSPAFQPDGSLRRSDLDWCLRKVLSSQGWRLSLQSHKLITAR